MRQKRRFDLDDPLHVVLLRGAEVRPGLLLASASPSHSTSIPTSRMVLYHKPERSSSQGPLSRGKIKLTWYCHSEFIHGTRHHSDCKKRHCEPRLFAAKQSPTGQPGIATASTPPRVLVAGVAVLHFVRNDRFLGSEAKESPTLQPGPQRFQLPRFLVTDWQPPVLSTLQPSPDNSELDFFCNL
jgi:hypothetical protein